MDHCSDASKIDGPTRCYSDLYQFLTFAYQP